MKAKERMYERGTGSGGGSGGGDNPAPRASVALTAQQWSAVMLAVSLGLGPLRDSTKIPVRDINQALRDLATATAEIQERLKCEALRRGEK